MESRRAVLRSFGAAVVGLLMAVAAWSSEIPPFTLNAPVRELVPSREAFAGFVVANRTALEAPLAGVERKAWLGMRAHLALNAHDSAGALAIVAELRALQSDPVEKAFAGLVTEAQVASWQPDRTFAREFSSRLAALPPTPAIRGLLQKQREKIAATLREELTAEAEQMGRRLDRAGRCDWLAADQIIRLHHRLNNILPLRADLLAGFDAAIAARAR